MGKYIFFDLDDTLYPEAEYVASGFQYVAGKLCEITGMSEELINMELEKVLEADGRGRVFNQAMKNLGISGVSPRYLVSLYRSHAPFLSLFSDAEQAIFVSNQFSKGNVFVLTDGNRYVQRKKVEALRIHDMVKQVFYTRDIGLRAEKPSVEYFERFLRTREEDFQSLIYVGDDPNKDFSGLNTRNATTIRVLTGRFAQQPAKKGYEAQHIIPNLDMLSPVINNL